ncbi:hypothetical protein J3F83DRAFT_750004 [Trichoderma novae-zelandiae]
MQALFQLLIPVAAATACLPDIMYLYEYSSRGNVIIITLPVHLTRISLSTAPTVTNSGLDAACCRHKTSAACSIQQASKQARNQQHTTKQKSGAVFSCVCALSSTHARADSTIRQASCNSTQRNGARSHRQLPPRLFHGRFPDNPVDVSPTSSCLGAYQGDAAQGHFPSAIQPVCPSNYLLSIVHPGPACCFCFLYPWVVSDGIALARSRIPPILSPAHTVRVTPGMIPLSCLRHAASFGSKSSGIVDSRPRGLRLASLSQPSH